MNAHMHAWARWTPDAGPPSDPFGMRESTRCLRAAAHVLAAVGVPSWADRALVVASASGDPDAPPGIDPLAHVPLRLAERLGPRSITAICAGMNTVAMSLIETVSRLHVHDRIVLLLVEPAPAAELAVAFAIENAEGRCAIQLDRAKETPSTPHFRNPCQAALLLADALDRQLASVHVGDRWVATFSWRPPPGNAQ